MIARLLYAPEGTPDPQPAPADPKPADPAPAPAEPQWSGMAANFPREVREKHKDALLGEFKDKKAHEVFEELLDARGRLTRSLVIPDPKTAKPEDMAAFRKTMGIPENGDGYELAMDAYKGIKGIDDLAKDFRTRALASGLTKTQAAAQFEYLANIAKFANDQQAAALKAQKDTFAQRILESVGGDEAKAKEVQTRYTAFMAKHFGDAELVKQMDASEMLYSSRFAAKIAALSALLDDEAMVDGKNPDEKPASKGAFGHYNPAFEAEFGGKK